MNQGVYPLAASMINQNNRLEQISNNLANVNTFGFKKKKKRAVFVTTYSMISWRAPEHLQLSMDNHGQLQAYSR